MKKISERTPVTLVNGELVRISNLEQPTLVDRLEALLDKLPEGSEQRQEFVCQLNIFLNVFENMYALDEDEEDGCPCDCNICDEDCDDWDEEDDDDYYDSWDDYDEDEFEDEEPIPLSSLKSTDEEPKRTRVKLVDGELIEITDEEDDDDEDSTDYDDEALADFFVELLTSMRSK